MKTLIEEHSSTALSFGVVIQDSEHPIQWYSIGGTYKSDTDVEYFAQKIQREFPKHNVLIKAVETTTKESFYKTRED